MSQTPTSPYTAVRLPKQIQISLPAPIKLTSALQFSHTAARRTDDDELYIRLKTKANKPAIVSGLSLSLSVFLSPSLLAPLSAVST